MLKAEANKLKTEYQKQIVPQFIFNEIELAARQGLSLIEIPWRRLEKSGLDPSLVESGLNLMGYTTWSYNVGWIFWPSNIMKIYF